MKSQNFEAKTNQDNFRSRSKIDDFLAFLSKHDSFMNELKLQLETIIIYDAFLLLSKVKMWKDWKKKFMCNTDTDALNLIVPCFCDLSTSM